MFVTVNVIPVYAAPVALTLASRPEFWQGSWLKGLDKVRYPVNGTVPVKSIWPLAALILIVLIATVPVISD